MNWQSEIESRLARAGADPDPDIVLELAQHAAAAFERARADGLDEAAAHARVATMIDAWCADPAAVRRRPRRDVAIDPPAANSRGFVGFGADLRYGLRQLRRQPGYALTAILVSALGIGAATTIFSVAYGVLLRPLPWPGADRLVRIGEVREGSVRRYGATTTNATYLAWRDKPETLEGLAAYDGGDLWTIGTGDDVERAPVIRTTASLFSLLEVRPHLGALFTAADERPGGGQVVVLSHRLWQRRFGGQPGAIGQSIDINDARYTIVGVMPHDFYFPDRDVAAWIPRYMPPVVNASNPKGRSIALALGIGRLRTGASVEQASSEGTARSRSAPDLGMVGIAMFGTNGPATVTVTPYLDAITADVQPALVVLFWAVGLLVAAGTANVAGMQLARATGRRREIAIRSALGAGSGRLARQLFTESAIVGLAGGLGGLAIAWGLHRVLPSILPDGFPRLDDVAIDARAAAFAIGIAFVATIVFGLIPAHVTRRQNLVETLTEDSLAPVGSGLRSRSSRLRSVVLAGQVAVATLLLVGASLVTRSFIALMTVDRGFNPRNLLTAEIPLPSRAFTDQRRVAFLDDLLSRVRAVPGVMYAAAGDTVPFLGRNMVMGIQNPRPTGQPGEPKMIHATVREVTPGYFEALGFRIRSGRTFTDADTPASQQVMIVSQTFVDRYLTGDPIGQELPFAFDPTRQDRQTIIGVVEDVRDARVTDPTQPIVYSNYRQRQTGWAISEPMLVVRTAGDPSAFGATVERLTRELDPGVRPQAVRTMEERLGNTLARPRLYALLLSGFGGFALLVCGIGLFGVLANSVAERRREIGIRAALGAQPSQVVRLIVTQGLTLTILGVTIGLGAAWFLAKQLGSLLYGITTHDAVTFGLVPLALIGTAVIACVAPARRATKVNPIIVLK